MSKINLGSPWPLGSTITKRGVNFSVAAPKAAKLQLLLFRTSTDHKPFKIINLENKHRSGDYWHVEVEGLKEGSLYSYRVFNSKTDHKKGNLSSKVLLDPCARLISGWEIYQRKNAIGPEDNSTACLKGVVSEREEFDFNSHPRPKHNWNQSVIYELHVGAFTSREDSGVSNHLRGKLLGLVEKLPYLKELGITTIELLPIQAFDSSDGPKGLENYWGYSPLNWFTPHKEYLCGNNPLDGRNQVREFIAACHDNNIEVLLDVVYNHTTEGNEEGPTISWRGFDESLYYFQNKEGNYLDVSGCGNSIAANRPIVRQLILESMRCWAIELGVDGFRFDLGIALSRGESLEPLNHPPLFEEIEADPELSDLKIISEPWDCGGLYKLGDFPAKRVRTWNGHFRDDLRTFWKGDKNCTWKLKERLRGSPDLYKGDNTAQKGPINFITSHDGFTLIDLLSFNTKHNYSNGENNRDGENNNHSWNHGSEGPSSDHHLIDLRRRQQRNLLSSLLLSPGVPMLLMGDEVGRSQGGNNNGWCQNSPISWMIWEKEKCDIDLKYFVKNLLKVRNQLPELFSSPIKEEMPLLNRDEANQQIWLQWHGVELRKPDFGNWSHTLSYSLNKGSIGSVLWVGLNACNQPMRFQIPKPTFNWVHLINTGNKSPEDFQIKPKKCPLPIFDIRERSLVVLMSSEYFSKLSFD